MKIVHTLQGAKSTLLFVATDKAEDEILYHLRRRKKGIPIVEMEESRSCGATELHLAVKFQLSEPLRKSDGHYLLRLKDCGTQKIPIIKLIRELTSLGLKEAKDLAEDCGRVVVRSLTGDRAEALALQFRSLGATVEVEVDK
jgi:ribosomal protein L7/L12